MRVQFTGMAYGGDALARHEGKPIFVPFALPGDVAEIEIVEDRGRFARGRIVQLLEPALDRVAPPCAHFGVCGGCHYQHIAYERQLALKTEIVREQLTRIGGIADPPVRAALASPEPYHYRNHAQFHVDAAGRLGYMAAKSNTVVPIAECHLLALPLEVLWRDLDLGLPDLEEVILRAGIHTGERLVALRLASTEALEAEIDLPVNCVLLLADGARVVLSGNDYFHESLAGRVYRVSAESFFQVNTAQAERLVPWVVARALEGAADEARLLDAYCGVGVFALALSDAATAAGKTARALGVEFAPDAVRDARENARGLPDIAIREGAVERVLPALAERFDVVVLDPPREGCAPALLDALDARGIPRIVYVSCDPSTLARDVKRLAAKGYRLLEVQPFDMFPQTFHIEAVAVLVKP